MKTGIFIRSFAGDKPWLEYCLRSLKKHAQGFSEVVVCLKNSDRTSFNGFDFHDARVVFDNFVHVSDYIAQQCSKLRSDLFMDADYIVQLDSDCFIHRPMHAQDFLVGDRPKMFIRLWKDAESAITWKKSTDEHLRLDTVFESMCRPGLIYHRNSFQVFRDYIQHVHRTDFITWAKSVQTLSEYNALGAIIHRYEPHLYHWIEWTGELLHTEPIWQKFSRAPGGVENFRQQYEEILAR